MKKLHTRLMEKGSDLQYSKRMESIQESPTLAVTARAAALKAQGRDVIGLGAGEPDFDTPPHIKEAAIAAIQRGFTKYTAVAGTPSLRLAVSQKLKRDNALDYAPNEVIISVGGKQAIFNFMLAVMNPGDEAIIPAPYWVSYVDIVKFAEGQPVVVPCGIEQAFKITPMQLEAAITPATRVFVLNSPSNPTGAVYSLDELRALGQILLRHPQIWIATDDMYEHINLSDDAFVNILNATPELKSRTIVFNGVSKAYAMTGWRIGYAAGPSALIKAMETLQSQSTSNPTSIAQVAAEAALNGDQGCITPMVQAFSERHACVVPWLNRMPGIHCLPARGAFYAFPDARVAIQRLYENGKISTNTDTALAEYLLEQHGVAIVPGAAFGAAGYFRLSFAADMRTLENALARLARAFT